LNDKDKLTPGQELMRFQRQMKRIGIGVQTNWGFPIKKLPRLKNARTGKAK
jgi:hypothetical protein